MTGVDNSDCHIDIDAASRALLTRVVVRAGEVMLAQPAAGQCLVLDADHLSIVVEENQP